VTVGEVCEGKTSGRTSRVNSSRNSLHCGEIRFFKEQNSGLTPASVAAYWVRSVMRMGSFRNARSSRYVFEEYLSTHPTLAGLARHCRRSPLRSDRRAHWPYLNKIVESGSGYSSLFWTLRLQLKGWPGSVLRPRIMESSATCIGSGGGVPTPSTLMSLPGYNPCPESRATHQVANGTTSPLRRGSENRYE
jgi:hypothetical protein